MRGAAVRAVCYAGFAALMAGAYVVVGITTGIWHPTWAIFLGGACAAAVGAAREVGRVR